MRVQTSIPHFSGYMSQMHRWFLFATLLVHEKRWPDRLTIFVLQGIHPLLLWGMIVLALQGGVMATGTVAAVLLLRHVLLRIIQRDVAAEIPVHPGLSVLSELLQPLHLVHAIVNRTIYWRSRRYRVVRNDRFISR